jgi:copper chaperone CopZ
MSSGTGTVTDTTPVATDAATTEGPVRAVVFRVPDMHCEFACAPTVRKTLAAVPGVRRVETDVEAHTATVYASAGFDETKALAALSAEGYSGKRVAE